MKQIYDFDSTSDNVCRTENAGYPSQSICFSTRKVLPCILLFLLLLTLGSVKSFAYNVPYSGSSSITTCSGTLYDNGGSGGSYSYSCNGYMIIYPGTAGAKVRLNGTVNTESGYDYFYIYNGVGTGGSVLRSGSGSFSVSNVTSTDPSGALTVYFTSDGSVQYSGFELTISCYNSNEFMVPYSGSNTIRTCSGTLYDHGGSSGYYSNYADGYTVIYPATAGAKVQLSGSGTTESCCDYLSIYNGVGTSGTPLYYGGGSTSGSISVSGIRSTDPTGALTVKFTSDISATYPGFSLNISCYEPALACPTLTTPANEATNVSPNPTFQWSAVNGATGYRLYLSTTPTRPASPTATIYSTYYNYSGLDYSTTYYWWVIPFGSEESPSCEPNSFTTGCPNPVPVPTVTASANTVNCGQEVTLTASGSLGNYKWYADAAGTQLLGEGATYTYMPSPGVAVYCQANCIARGATVTVNKSYTGGVQTFIVPANVDELTLQVWGAQGGTYSSYQGGKGGYASGTLPVSQGDVLYIYVGGTTSSTSGGYNGGGSGQDYYYSGTSTYTRGGGGATDIRVNTDNLYARVLVGGGGSGATSRSPGWYGGGTTSGGYSSTFYATQSAAGNAGSFGQGGNSTGYTNYRYGPAGGGGGWYGGGSGMYYSDSYDYYSQYAGGGSGYVNTSSSYHPSGYLYPSNYFLSNTSLIAGNATMPNPDGGTMTGRSGSGYARISYQSGSIYSSAMVSKTVTVISSPEPQVETEPACNNSTTTLRIINPIQGLTYGWFTDEDCNNLVYEGTEFVTPVLNGYTTYYVRSYTLVPGIGGGEQSQDFAYTGGVQTFTIPAGVSELTLEVWGAQGGGSQVSGNTNNGVGGKGGYSIGTLPVQLSDQLSVYVGGQGTSVGPGIADGGWNGGGTSYASSNTDPAAGGGGATDIRVNGSSLYNRVIVAGGGGGGGEDTEQGGYGGGLTGGIGSGNITTGGSQTSSGTGGVFGYGANTTYDGGAGGGGWYGGGTAGGSQTIPSSNLGNDAQGGCGGSGYVWTSATAGSAPNGYLVSSAYYLSDAQTIAGNATMPNPAGGTMTGRTGNGYARITWEALVPSCESAIHLVELFPNPSPTVSVTPSQYTACNQTVQLYALTSNDVTNYQWSEGVSGTQGNFTATPLMTTTYTLTVTNNYGCTASDETTITVNSPNVEITATPGSNCVDAGDALDLTVENLSIGMINDVSQYSLSVSQEPYQSITGTSLSTGDYATNQLSLPFTFSYCGTDYSGLYYTTDGYVYLGSSATSARLAAFGGDLVSSTGYYTTQGTAPNRVFIIQQYGYRWNTSYYFNFQIRLHETTNEISYHYGSGFTSLGETYTYYMGLQDPNNANVLNVTPTSSSTADINTSSYTEYISTTQANYLASGTVYTFSPTPPCNYLWSTGATTQSITVSPTENTTYTVTVSSDEYTCNAVLEQQVTVNPIIDITATPPTICTGGSSEITASGADSYQWNNGQQDATITVWPTNATTYSVTGTTEEGCSTSGSVTVTIPVFSAGSISSGNQTVCSSHAVPITIASAVDGTGGGDTHYRWSRNNILLANSDMADYDIVGSEISTLSGTYTYVRQFKDECTNIWTSSSGSYTLTVNPSMEQPQVAGDREIVCGATTTLTASGVLGASYRWFADAEGTQLLAEGAEFVTPAVLGNTTYYVQAYNPPIEGIENYVYTGGQQTFTVPAGVSEVTLEVWGAEGGYRSSSTYGGNGGYSTGTLAVTPGSTLYVYVGGSGNTGGTSGGYNGGGSRSSYAGGGGATHIATTQGILSTLSSNRTAVKIVAGGGGSDGAANKQGMYGGGTTGGTATESFGTGGGGGTQTAGGSGGSGNSGYFGRGGSGLYYSSGYGGAGGGGWYGGGGVYPDGSRDDDRGGGGGSGYIGGVTNGQTIAGNSSMPNPNGGTMTGRTGNGYARISYFAERGCPSILLPVTIQVEEPAAPQVPAHVVADCGTSAILAVIDPVPTLNYLWYDDAECTHLIGEGDTIAVVPGEVNTYYVRSCAGNEGGVFDFEYTGAPQTFTIPDGVSEVTLEVWGAQGGGTAYSSYTWLGGHGGYSTGTLSVSPNDILKVYVGGVGQTGRTGTGTATGGYNGGGNSGTSSSSFYGGAGGGGTDIRLNGTALNDRVIVAGGGGGAAYGPTTTNTINGGAGGGLNGVNGIYNSSYSTRAGLGGTQSAGGSRGTYSSDGYSGTLGVGGAGGNGNAGGAGGGGGYYGGGGGNYGSSMAGPAGGGSGYIGRVTDGQTIAGDASMPNPAGGTMIGREGDGFARITIIGDGVGCLSPISQVSISVREPIAPDVVSDTTIDCGTSVTLAVQNANPQLNYRWYDDAACTNLVHEGPTFTISSDNAVTYYVNSVAGGRGGEYDFEYTGASQTFTVPAGVSEVTLEVWGAQGGQGGSSNLGAKGGYSVGTMSVSGGDQLYINVGGAGVGYSGTQAPETSYQGGYNGGGNSYSGANGVRGSGGGATDIRVGADGLYNRVIVAGGGGGNLYFEGYSYSAGVGGGITGGIGGATTAATQSAAGTADYSQGAFGQGGGIVADYTICGGGGGWYGGAGVNPAGGGSGFVWTSATAGSAPAGYLVSTSYYLSDAQTIAGNASMPNPAGGTMTGRTGNGFARITIASSPETCLSPTSIVNVSVRAPQPPQLQREVEIHCGDQPTLAVINANPQLNYKWYDNAECTNLVHEGPTFTVSPENTTTYYVRSSAGSESFVLDFDYTGAPQTFTVPAGVSEVMLEVWGAQGGGTTYSPGLGGYSVGTMSVSSSDVLTIFVGGRGNTASTSSANWAYGGYNGGGDTYSQSRAVGSGGGATDVRVNGNTYYHRVIVAGGGGGGGNDTGADGMCGGGTNGGGSTSLSSGSKSVTSYLGGTAGAGTQTSGGDAQIYQDSEFSNSAAGSFGEGGIYYALHTSNTSTGAGGGGWYGGGVQNHRGGGGGSGYVWTPATASYAPVGYLVPTSYYLSDAQTIAGNASMPNPAGGTMVGRVGNGFARISSTGSGIMCLSETSAITVTVLPPQLPAVDDAEIVCGQTAHLSVNDPNPNYVYTWYADAACTQLLHTGTNWDVPELGDTTTFYVKSEIVRGGGDSIDFEYTGAPQTFTVPSGVSELTLEVWGAQGGGNFAAQYWGTGGNGGYSTGTLSVASNDILNIYVGQQGFQSASQYAFNGGGYGNPNSEGYGNGATGGGATDVRLNGTSYSSRVIVAGGGGGASGATSSSWPDYAYNGGAGGGLTGLSGISSESYRPAGTGGTQTSGGTSSEFSISASLGLGACASTTTGDCIQGGGGGGGYYGGGAGGHAGGGGGGGSSYIGGVTNAQTIAGNASMPNPAGGTMVGREGNGFARIIYNSEIILCASGVAEVSVNVNPIAPPTFEDHIDVICGTIAQLTPTNVVDGCEYRWYADPECTQLLYTGLVFPTAQITDTTTYYVKAFYGQLPDRLVEGEPIDFAYTGSPQTYTVPVDVNHVKLQVWGAQGGTGGDGPYAGAVGGKGAFVEGMLDVNVNDQISVIVGGRGTSTVSYPSCPNCAGGAGGYGGGGGGGGAYCSGNAAAGGGGGGFSMIKYNSSILMVAAGGGGGGGGSSTGGSQHGSGGVGGAGGAANGINGSASGGGGSYGYGASQYSGGSAGSGGYSGGYLYGGGADGVSDGSNGNAANYAGGVGGSGSCNASAGGSGGGGGGYYGGGGGGTYASGGGGGSSYVTGLTETQMIAGNASMPDPMGGQMTGKEGNGFVRIIPIVLERGNYVCESEVVPVGISVIPLTAPWSWSAYADPADICAGDEVDLYAFANDDEPGDDETPMVLWSTDTNGNNVIGFIDPEDPNSGFLTVAPADSMTYYVAAATDMLSASGSFDLSTPNNPSNLYGYGYFFDVQAGASAMEINTIDVTPVNIGTYNVQIYYKQGTCEGSTASSSGWLNAGSFTQNFVAQTPVTITLPNPISVPANQTYALYISSSAALYYDQGTTAGEVWANSRFMTIYQGYGVPAASGYDAGGFYSNLETRNYKGKIGYELHDMTVFGCISPEKVRVDVYVHERPVPPASIEGDTLLCNGDALTLTAVGGNLGDDGSYDWYTIESGVHTNIGTEESITVSPDHSTTYYLRYENPYCGPTDSVSHFVFVNAGPVVADIEQPDAICDGDVIPIDVPELTFYGDDTYESITLSGWQHSADGIDYEVIIEPEIPETYTGHFIRYMAENNCGQGYSNAVTLIVDSLPYVETLQAPAPICYGSTVDWTNVQPSVDYHNNSNGMTSEGWEVKVNNQIVNFSPSMILDYGNQITASYWAENECGRTYSNEVEVVIYDVPRLGMLAEIAPICAGDTLPVIAPTITDAGGTSYVDSWEFSPTYDAVDYTTFPSDSILDYEMNNYYVRYAINNVCGTTYSNYTQIVVNDKPYLSDITDPNPNPICSGSPLIMDSAAIVNTAGHDVTAQGWIQTPDSLMFDNTVVTPFSITDLIYDDWRDSWVRYYAENACGIRYSRAVRVDVHPAHHLTVSPADTSVCFGSSLEIEASSDVSPNATFAWEQSDGGHLVSLEGPIATALRPSQGQHVYTVTATDVTTGCTETVESHVNAFPIGSDQYMTLCASELPYIFGDESNRVLCDQSGDFRLIFQSQTGCDSVVTLHLNVIYPIESRVRRHLCEGETYNWYVNGREYTESTRDTIRIAGSGGCDSIVYYLDLTIANLPYVELASREVAVPLNVEMQTAVNCRTACDFNTNIKMAMEYQLYKDGEPVDLMGEFGEVRLETEYELAHQSFGILLSRGYGEIPGTTYSMYNYDYDFFYFNFFTTANNRLRATWHEPGEYKIVFRLVEKSSGYDYPYLFNDTQRLGGAGSSPGGRVFSIDSLTIFVHPVDSTSEDLVLCESQLPYDYFGTELTHAGDYEIMYTVEDRYEMRTVHVTINPTIYTNFAVNSCATEYVWDGQTYTQSSVYENGQPLPFVRTYTSSTGCDSVVSMQLFLGNSQYEVETNVSACDEYYWDQTGMTYTESGDYTYFAWGTGMDCDTNLTLHLTINHSYVTVDTLFVSSLEIPYFYQGYELTTDGDYSINLQTESGCDSIVMLSFTISDPAIVVDEISTSSEVGDTNSFTVNIDPGQYNDAIKVGLDYEIYRNGELISDVSEFGDVYFETEYSNLNRYIGRNLITGTGSVPANTFNVIYYAYNYFYLHFFNSTNSRMTATWDVPGYYTIRFKLHQRTGGNDISLTYGNSGKRLGGSGSDNTNVLLATNEINMMVPGTLTEYSLDTTVCSSTIPFLFHGTLIEGPIQTTVHCSDPYNVYDSIIHLTLHVNPSYDFRFSDAVCYGGDYQGNGFELSHAQIDSLTDGETFPYQLKIVHSFNSILNCDSIRTLYLTVLPQPELEVAGNTTICQGEDIQLIAGGCDSYAWSSTERNEELQLIGLRRDTIVTATGFTTYSSLASVNAIEVGDIVTADGFVVPADLYNESGKTAIGVIYDVNMTSHRVKMVALKDHSSFWSADVGYLDSAINMTDGRINQSRIATMPVWRGIYAAFNYCDTLTLPGFDSWFLPAYEEFNMSATNLATVNASLGMVRGMPLDLDAPYLTSTEYDADSCYVRNFNNESLFTRQKRDVSQLRPVGNFEPTSMHMYPMFTQCAKIDTLPITVIPLDSTAHLNVAVCVGEEYYDNYFDVSSQETAVPGIIRDTVVTGSSICGTYRLALALTVYPIYDATHGYFDIEDEVCEGYDYQGYGFALPYDTIENHAVNGVAEFLAPNLNVIGCDSVTRLILTINPTKRDTLLEEYCYASEYEHNNELYTASQDTIFTDIYFGVTADGCDSIVTTMIHVMPLPNTQLLSDTVCFGTEYSGTIVTDAEEVVSYFDDGVVVNGTSLTHDALTSTMGVTVVSYLGECELRQENVIVVRPEVVVYLEDNACAETHYHNYGFDFDVPSVATSYDYELLFADQHGCDSTVILTLTVDPIDTVDVNDTVSIVDMPYNYRGEWYTQGGEYLIRTDGQLCDMIIRWNLVVINEYGTNPFMLVDSTGVNTYSLKVYANQYDINSKVAVNYTVYKNGSVVTNLEDDCGGRLYLGTQYLNSFIGSWLNASMGDIPGNTFNVANNQFNYFYFHFLHRRENKVIHNFTLPGEYEIVFDLLPQEGGMNFSLNYLAEDNTRKYVGGKNSTDLYPILATKRIHFVIDEPVIDDDEPEVPLTPPTMSLTTDVIYDQISTDTLTVLTTGYDENAKVAISYTIYQDGIPLSMLSNVGTVRLETYSIPSSRYIGASVEASGSMPMNTFRPSANYLYNYFYLHFLNETHSRIIANWNVSGNYAIVFELMEMTGGTDLPLTWESDKRLGGKNGQNTGLVLASDTLFYLLDPTQLFNPSGINENTELSVSIYPNPAQSYFVLTLSETTDATANIQITDVNGKLMENYQINNLSDNQIRVNINNWAQGVYFVTLKDGNQTITKKLVVSK